MRRGRRLAGLCAALVLSAAGLSAQETGPKPLEDTLGRPGILYMDGLLQARPKVQVHLEDLYAQSGAFAVPDAVRELADIDVYVLIMADKSVQDLPDAFPLKAVIASDLAQAAPESGLNAFSTPIYRAPGAPEQIMRVILVDQSRMAHVSDLCLAVALHDLGRWYFSDPGQSQVGPAYRRVAVCTTEDWQTTQEAF